MADINRMIELLNQDAEMHRCEAHLHGEYYKVYTDYLLGISNDYLPLYLIEEDGEWGFSDANTIYAILTDFYEVTEERLKEAGKAAGLQYDAYRFLAYPVDEGNVVEAAHKFGKVVAYLLKTCPR